MQEEKFKRRTPLLSYINYALHEAHERDIDKPAFIRVAKTLGHLAYMIIGIGIPFWYAIGVVGTSGELNPIRQLEIVRKANEEKAKEQEQYKKSWQDIFGYGGYADLNSDGVVNFDEKVDAFRKMDLIGEYDVPVEGKTQFPEPKLSDLEKAIQTYKNDRR